MTSFLGAPVAVRGHVFGNIYLCDKVGGGEFTEDDEVFVVNLASVASLAIENARLHARVAELATLEDRERIARDLHDTVIQRLFAVGLSLQATQRLVDDAVVSSRLLTAVDDLDTTVRDIRAAIFELQVAHRSGPSVRQQLLDLAAQSAPALGFDPVIRFDGPIDAAVDPSLAEDLLAVLREALTNIAKHAHATRAEVGCRGARPAVDARGDRRRGRIRPRARPRPRHRQPAHPRPAPRRGLRGRRDLAGHPLAGHHGAMGRADPLRRPLIDRAAGRRTDDSKSIGVVSGAFVRKGSNLVLRCDRMWPRAGGSSFGRSEAMLQEGVRGLGRSEKAERTHKGEIAMARIGGEIEQLGQLKTTFDRESRTVEELTRVIRGQLQTTVWEGPAAERFRSMWSGEFEVSLRKLQEALVEAGTEVSRRQTALLQAGS